MNALAWLGCAVGRGPFMSVGNTWHHARLFTLHVGRSGEGRKGDAVSLLKRIARRVKEMDENLAPQIHAGGLSSREGLAFMIHDGFKDGNKEVPAINDKRLWVIESEFANVLHQGRRDGNTLSTALRDCWDGASLRPATKGNRCWATDPHVCLSAAITPSELRTTIAARDLSNGFANRFLTIWAERPRMLPFPKATPEAQVNHLAERVCEVLRYCGADRLVDRDALRVSLSADAMDYWKTLYTGELNDRGHGERINALIERRAPMLLRIAMLLALTDLTDTVGVHHLQAALAWIRYSVESVRFIFASAADEAVTEETNVAASKIVEFLKNRGRVTRNQLRVECFSGHVGGDSLDAALDDLLTCNPPRIRVDEDRSKPGRPTKFYELVARKAFYALNGLQQGFPGDFAPCAESVESVLSPDHESARGGIKTQKTLIAQSQKQPETRANARKTLKKHKTQANSETTERTGATVAASHDESEVYP
jgi:hypothetical protein